MKILIFRLFGFSPEIWKVFSAQIKSSISLSFFYLGSFLLKYKKFFRVSVSWNIRKLSITNFHFLKYKKSFFEKTLTNLRKWEIYLFFELGLKSVPSSHFCKTVHLKCLTVPWISLRFSIYQGSEYTSSSKYISILNTPYPKYKKVPFPEN